MKRARAAKLKPRPKLFGSMPGAGDRFLTILGCAYLILLGLSWIWAPNLGAAWLVITNYVVMAVFVAVALIKRPDAFPISLPIAVILALQVWSIACTVYVNTHLGREIRLGRVDLYLLAGLIPAFVCWRTALVWPDFRVFAKKAVLAMLGLSAVVAWMQFFRLPPSMTLANIYTYKPIDNWDGHPGIRAVGLSAQPNHLAFQMVIGLALSCASAIRRKLTRGEYGLGVLFAAAAFFTQSRAGIIPLALVMLALLYFVWKHDRKTGAIAVGVLIAIALAAGTIAARRFEYLTMTTSGNDYSAAAREDIAWSQVTDIINELPFTGIGPSSGLLLGGGPEDRWVPVGRPVESGYLVFQAMYGFPGLILLIVGLFGSLWTACAQYLRTADDTRRQWLIVGAVCALHLIINAYSFNTFDSYLHLPMACLIAGLATAPSLREAVAPDWRRSRLAKKYRSRIVATSAETVRGLGRAETSGEHA